MKRAKNQKLQLIVDEKEFANAKRKFIEQANRDLEMGKYTQTLPPIIIKRNYEEEEDPFYNWKLDKIIGSEVIYEDKDEKGVQDDR